MSSTGIRVMVSPSRWTLPEVGRTSPEIVRSSVVLPAPLAPSTAVTVPSGTWKRGVVERADRAVVGRQLLNYEHRSSPPARASGRPPRRGQVRLEHALVLAHLEGAPAAITRPKSSTTIRSQTDVTRSMWWSTSITAIELRSESISLRELRHLVRAEAARRLVQKQQLGLGHERSRQRDPLLHGERQRRRHPIGDVGAVEPLQRHVRPLSQLALVAIGPRQRKQRAREPGAAEALARRPSRSRPRSAARTARLPAASGRSRAKRAVRAVAAELMAAPLERA